MSVLVHIRGDVRQSDEGKGIVSRSYSPWVRCRFSTTLFPFTIERALMENEASVLFGSPMKVPWGNLSVPRLPMFCLPVIIGRWGPTTHSHHSAGLQHGNGRLDFQALGPGRLFAPMHCSPKLPYAEGSSNCSRNLCLSRSLSHPLPPSPTPALSPPLPPFTAPCSVPRGAYVPLLLKKPHCPRVGHWPSCWQAASSAKPSSDGVEVFSSPSSPALPRSYRNP